MKRSFVVKVTDTSTHNAISGPAARYRRERGEDTSRSGRGRVPCTPIYDWISIRMGVIFLRARRPSRGEGKPRPYVIVTQISVREALAPVCLARAKRLRPMVPRTISSGACQQGPGDCHAERLRPRPSVRGRAACAPDMREASTPEALGRLSSGACQHCQWCPGDHQQGRSVGVACGHPGARKACAPDHPGDGQPSQPGRSAVGMPSKAFSPRFLLPLKAGRRPAKSMRNGCEKVTLTFFKNMF
jgi:hypothetical protein